ncbi:5-formyltetrahydrofolate cyclo-ligase [Salsuginibacillus halophilus]|uniref:5-formyltetrahydrofolate cyclo-ligase n=1 Tax=Salsuginibacillus halophilus TaxID=517424 RepID=A0A2P8H7V3_9BACI|nr:5-formyltetrahydrofolate cyclo-ligase [Salsuginibacillus halophilus]PSL42317.1 5-formyltetrahydrofolate cyclo-ligase [Salsuginibacillus halophilus]
MATKEILRSDVKRQFLNLSRTEYQLRSKQVQAALLADPAWQRADMIGLTVSTPQEIDTYGLLEAAWASGKRTAVPKADAEHKSLAFYEIKDFDELSPAFAGILEPKASREKYVAAQRLELLVVPGFVFDAKGYRIGFGGGFYDRFLAEHKIPSCSIGLNFQYVDRLEPEVHDMPVDQVFIEGKEEL